MITSILHKGFASILALLVLFSTFSFTVEKHYCGDHLVDTAIFTKVKNCGMEESTTTEATVTKKSCCKDVVEIIKGQDELKLNFDDLDTNAQFVFTAFVYSYAQLYQSLPKQIVPHQYYSPPNLVIDYQVLHDVFII
ncbi:hypothetical protein [Olleya sp. YS]|uniref:HYC_CC_PP family protein n=1 Tax=Olleya sp. YS TaxID=3028318 RepID=UPI0024341DB4|nr:hypothetical protein [Olleya sp. YS]WGD34184.1 hypothetical protein Ollyesu_10395 [Olleya sp. YS]